MLATVVEVGRNQFGIVKVEPVGEMAFSPLDVVAIIDNETCDHDILKPLARLLFSGGPIVTVVKNDDIRGLIDDLVGCEQNGEN